MENVNSYVILDEVAKKLLYDKNALGQLSYPAKRVLYAGRGTGSWYTKSKAVHDEIMNLYKKIKSDTSKSPRHKSKSAVNAADLDVSEKELKMFLTLIEKLLIRKG